jgi:site-specific DNA-adenine methylase
MHMTATLTKWYEENGRHEIFAGGKSVQLNSKEHSLVLRESIVTNEIQHDLDRLGIAKNSTEEKIRARASKIKAQEENERMMKLYRQHVLKEEPRADLVSLGEIKPAAPLASIKPAPKAVEEREEVGSFGD